MPDQINHKAMRALEEPFDPGYLQWKPQVVTDGSVLLVAYLDPRLYAQRLTEVLGPDGWQFDIKEVGGNTYHGLAIRTNGEWAWHWDIGYSGKRDDNIRLKGATSDGLKRAAALVGVGRYLYFMPGCWVDAKTKPKANGRGHELVKILGEPTVPHWATSEHYQRARTEGAAWPPPSNVARLMASDSDDEPGDEGKAPGKNGNGPKAAKPAGDKSPTQAFWDKAFNAYDLERPQALEFVEAAGGDFEVAMAKMVASLEPPAEDEPTDEEIPF